MFENLIEATTVSLHIEKDLSRLPQKYVNFMDWGSFKLDTSIFDSCKKWVAATAMIKDCFHGLKNWSKKTVSLTLILLSLRVIFL